MFLRIDSYNLAGSGTILDIENIYGGIDGTTPEGLANALMYRAYSLAVREGEKFDTIMIDDISQEYGGDGITVMYESAPTNAEKIYATFLTVAKFFLWALDADEEEEGVAWAYLSDNGWQAVDFDDIEHTGEEFHAVFDGDYEDFGREALDASDIILPPLLKPYFDFGQYGEDMLDQYNQVEWGGKTYLFY